MVVVLTLQKLAGVVAVHTARDVPGTNSILYPVAFGGVSDEPVSVSVHTFTEPATGTNILTHPTHYSTIQ